MSPHRDKESRRDRTRGAKTKERKAREIRKDPKWARELGAAYKPDYPATYTKSQTGPVFRESPRAQKTELERLVATSGMNWGAAYSALKGKYEKAGHEWHPKMGK